MGAVGRPDDARQLVGRFPWRGRPCGPRGIPRVPRPPGLSLARLHGSLLRVPQDGRGTVSTPGPWSWMDAWPDEEGFLNARRLAGPNGATVARANTDTDICVSEADGELIANAWKLAAKPALLERL